MICPYYCYLPKRIVSLHWQDNHKQKLVRVNSTVLYGNINVYQPATRPGFCSSKVSPTFVPFELQEAILIGYVPAISNLHELQQLSNTFQQSKKKYLNM